MAGCGKTVAVCQSIRHVIESDDCFKANGVYWIKIGNNICLESVDNKLFSSNLL